MAVVGAGVMGLTAATLLTKDYTVSIYADRLSGTTSDVAGGQWAPSVVEFDQSNAAAKQQFEDILRVAYRMHEQRIGQNFGVSYRTNYTKKLSATFDKVPKDIIPAPDDYPQLPFAKLKSKGYGYKTLLVEPPVFLTRLRADLRTAGVVPQHKVFGSAADVTNLAEPTIINCTGHGAGVLFHDKDIVPIKGQLVLLKAQPGLDYLYSTDQTYVFPRSDHVVVGGSYECGVDDENPVPSMCEHIRKMAEDVFAGLAFTTADDRPWLMRNK
ncbi:FAD-binding oxidoreductase [Mesorhizobium sp. M0848]|uniref:FAD-dependent oxidoreductase n=1 Tax=Mesorhizobium sp. M0848 TaxID=2957012 RepID=UPI00333AFE8A